MVDASATRSAEGAKAKGGWARGTAAAADTREEKREGRWREGEEAWRAAPDAFLHLRCGGWMREKRGTHNSFDIGVGLVVGVGVRVGCLAVLALALALVLADGGLCRGVETGRR